MEISSGEPVLTNISDNIGEIIIFRIIRQAAQSGKKIPCFYWNNDKWEERHDLFTVIRKLLEEDNSKGIELLHHNSEKIGALHQAKLIYNDENASSLRYKTDGMHALDVALMVDEIVFPFEIKLGQTAWEPNDFCNKYSKQVKIGPSKPVKISKSASKRPPKLAIHGSVPAILNGNIETTDSEGRLPLKRNKFYIIHGDRSFPICEHWGLIGRKLQIDKLKKMRVASMPPNLNQLRVMVDVSLISNISSVFDDTFEELRAAYVNAFSEKLTA